MNDNNIWFNYISKINIIFYITLCTLLIIQL